MKAALLAVALLAVALLLTLSSCQRSSSAKPGDLSALLLQLAVGSLDSSSSGRERVVGNQIGRRKLVHFDRGVPQLNASSAKVYYDGEQRASAWRVTLETGAPLKDFLGGSTLESLGSWNGQQMYRAKGDPLEGTVIGQKGRTLDFYSSGYTLRYAPELLAWLGKR